MHRHTPAHMHTHARTHTHTCGHTWHVAHHHSSSCKVMAVIYRVFPVSCRPHTPTDFSIGFKLRFERKLCHFRGNVHRQGGPCFSFGRLCGGRATDFLVLDQVVVKLAKVRLREQGINTASAAQSLCKKGASHRQQAPSDPPRRDRSNRPFSAGRLVPVG